MRVDDILNNFLQENGFDCHAMQLYKKVGGLDQYDDYEGD